MSLKFAMVLCRQLAEWFYEKLKPLTIDKCPFVDLPETGRARWGELLDAEKMKKCVWVRPQLVTVVEFLEWTEGDRLRHSKFVVLRDDKDPRWSRRFRERSTHSVVHDSALLMLVDPERYGVIDIRGWQLLHKLGTVRKNASGVGFSFRNWYQFLRIIRHFASKFGVMARDVERTLFLVHKEYHAGRLYKANKW